MITWATPLAFLAAVPIVLLVAYAVRRQGVRLLFRAAPLLLLLVAVAGPQIMRSQLQRHAVLLVDRSSSVTRTVPDQAIAGILDRIVQGHPDTTFGAIAFSDTPALVAPLGTIGSVVELPPGSDATNLAAAFDLAVSVLPVGEGHQLVLISDGRFTDEAMIAIDTAQALGIPISIVPVGAAVDADVAMVAIEGPSEVGIGRPFSVDLELSAAHPMAATVAVYRDDELLQVDEVDLVAGRTPHAFTDTIREAGGHTYQAIVKAADDPIPENDALSLLVSATERRPVLLVDREGNSAIPALLDALGLGFSRTAGVPSLERLSAVRHLVLTGTSLAALTGDELAALDGFVRRLGGGLMVVEGEEEVWGLTSGGIERLLPVSYTRPETGREAELALVYVLDRSSSMRSRVGGIQKIEILKEATAASAALLAPTTRVGILTFNLDHTWTVPIGPAEDVEIYEPLRALQAIGGTDIYYPLVEALDRLDEIEVPSKHLLLISDGKTLDQPRNYPGLVRRLEELDDVTLSAIGVGRTMNVPLLSALVEAGGGTLYRADDFALLPQVSIEATQRITRRRFAEGPVEVAGGLLESLGLDVPPLEGYVVTYPKPTAETHLWANSDPIVSTWRAGLGRVAVLNTDLRGEGSASWLSWPELARLFGAILDAVEPAVGSQLGLSASIVTRTPTLELLIDARDPDGGFANFLDLEVTLLPDGETVTAVQRAPGLYVASLAAPPPGGYAAQVLDRDRDRRAIVPLTVAYPSEYRGFGPDHAALERIARATGGRVLDAGDALPVDEGAASMERFDLHVPFLLAALGFFLIDLGARKWPRRRPRGHRGEGR